MDAQTYPCKLPITLGAIGLMIKYILNDMPMMPLCAGMPMRGEVNRCGTYDLPIFRWAELSLPLLRAPSPLSCGTRDGVPAAGLQLPAGDPWRLLEASSEGRGGLLGWALASPASPSLAILSLWGPQSAPVCRPVDQGGRGGWSDELATRG